MNETEKTVNDLNVAKNILCHPQMLTPEMCVRIGKVITSAIALLKEQETANAALKVLADRQCEVNSHHYERKGFCPKCHQEVKLILNRNYCGFCGQAVKWND